MNNFKKYILGFSLAFVFRETCVVSFQRLNTKLCMLCVVHIKAGRREQLEELVRFKTYRTSIIVLFLYVCNRRYTNVQHVDDFLRDSCPSMVENMSFCEASEGNTGQLRGKEEEIHVALLAS